MTRIRLRVTARARKNAILGMHSGAIKIAVTAAPERGRANDAVVALLAAALDLPPSSVELVAGATSRDKFVSVDLTRTEVEARLSSALR